MTIEKLKSIINDKVQCATTQYINIKQKENRSAVDIVAMNQLRGQIDAYNDIKSLLGV